MTRPNEIAPDQLVDGMWASRGLGLRVPIVIPGRNRRTVAGPAEAASAVAGGRERS
ncbi:hypothetical protein ABT115_15890 [Streptomyces sp. NPDC001832]|uniref:hypothetical protein n=1 Tax=Streptomyces sp. NPDC001832 TaxID=3154527 RepID=UPI00331EF68D